MNTPVPAQPPGDRDLESERLELEFERIAVERSNLELQKEKLKMEASGPSSSSSSGGVWQLISNPLLIAIIGGSVTLFTSILTTYLTANSTREADSRKFQADLIKTFVNVGDHETSRNNLTFLADVGLIPDHEEKVRHYKDNNTQNALPVLAESAPGKRPACPPLNIGPMPRSDRKPRGISIHLANNRVDPNGYQGTSIPLRGAVADATSMLQMADDLGYHLNFYPDSLSCADYLLTWLDSLAPVLQEGDTLLLTRSGSGTQIPDLTRSEPDGLEESWVMFDRMIGGSELYDKFAKFKKGVTIIVVQDACNTAPFRRPKNRPELAANLIALCATKEDEQALEAYKDNKCYGAFTRQLLDAMKNRDVKNYRSLMDAIKAAIPEKQTPMLYVYPEGKDIEARKPFAIEP